MGDVQVELISPARSPTRAARKENQPLSLSMLDFLIPEQFFQ